jgi:hypothetical protein
LSDASTRWVSVTVANWYGARAQRVQIASDAAVWYHSGKPVGPLRRVLIRAPAGRFAPQALRATNHRLTPVHILTSFARRWPMEVTFEEARAHLGVESQRQGSHQAIARTTPALLALDSMVTWIAAPLIGNDLMPVRTAAWSGKESATFSDTMALVRRCLGSQGTFPTSEAGAELVKVPRALLDRFTDALCYAA